jgi:putative PIN family toxin of toxin-antitoxin system
VLVLSGDCGLRRPAIHRRLDPNVLIAALLSRGGAPAQLLGGWLSGEFELVVSEALLAELERALAYPKLRKHVTQGEVDEFVTLLHHGAMLGPDPPNPARHSADPGNDYLVALAESKRAVLISGDHHLLALGSDFPIQSPRAFLDSLAGR